MSPTSVSQVQSAEIALRRDPAGKTAVAVELGTVKPLLGASLAELTEWVQQQGQPAYRGKQLYQWIYEKAVRSISDISVFPKQWREALVDTPIGRSTLHYRSQAPDGTVKYLLQLADGNIIETVGIPTFARGGEEAWDGWDDE